MLRRVEGAGQHGQQEEVRKEATATEEQPTWVSLIGAPGRVAYAHQAPPGTCASAAATSPWQQARPICSTKKIEQIRLILCDSPSRMLLRLSHGRNKGHRGPYTY